MKFHSNIAAGLIKAVILLTVLTLSTGAFASKGFVAGPHYFYSLVQSDVAGKDQTHHSVSGYEIPACAKLSDSEFKKLKRNCQSMGENSKKCATEKTVTLKAGGSPAKVSAGKPDAKVMKEAQKVDDTTKTYKLDYIVFVSEDDCKEAREHELEGE